MRAARWLGGAAVAIAALAWYWLFFLPPRLVGSADPDRQYHLGISKLMAARGLLHALPQAEDLGWGRYFPDKEFLFHALTGSAWAAGGESAVLWLVPLLGTAILLCLYLGLSRELRPLPSALLAIAVPLATVGFMFRLSLLRPHLLAVLVFCLLVLAVLRGRPRLAGLAAALFALSYHAFYVVGIVAAAAWLLRRQPGMAGRTWAWCLGGLLLGVLLNPYFPSNLEMSLLHLRLALGLEGLPLAEEGPEMVPPGPLLLVFAYGFLAVVLTYSALGAWLRKPQAGAQRTGFAFVFMLTLVFASLGTRSLRAMEYAVPAGVLLAGYSVATLRVRHALPLLLVALFSCQGFLAFQFYREAWLRPVQSGFPEYAALLRQVPTDRSYKVFNCEWEAGSFVLLERPDLRFVDLLEPAFLWHASPTRYQARRGLIAGAFADPRAILRGAFKADYVLCAAAPLIRQMEARPADFRAAPGTQGDKVRLFAVRPD